MKTTIYNLLQVKLKYVYEVENKDGSLTLIYQRKVPIDLQSRYGKKLIKEPLYTYDLAKASKRVSDLNKKHEAIWDALRGNPEAVPSTVRETAKTILSQHGLKPHPHRNHEQDVDRFINEVLETKRVAHALGDDFDYYRADPKDFLSSSELEALKLLNVKSEVLLSDVLNQYLDTHKRAGDEDYRVSIKRVWDSLLMYVGDKPIKQTTREDGRTFIHKRLAEGVTTGTVRRNLNTLHSVFEIGLLENSIKMVNPFSKLSIPNEGEDAKKRETFSQKQLLTLAQGCKAEDDDIRWALAIQMDLGSRIGEVVGLTLDEIILDHETPHIHLTDRPWRKIKTHETRYVPLVGMALWAAKRVKETAKEGQFFAFPRYNPDGVKGKTRRDSASAALNKYMDSQGLDRTTHELRHTMRDRLRNVNAIGLVMDAIGGWGKQNIGDNYGHGYALNLMQEWMQKVVLEV